MERCFRAGWAPREPGLQPHTSPPAETSVVRRRGVTASCWRVGPRPGRNAVPEEEPQRCLHVTPFLPRRGVAPDDLRLLVPPWPSLTLSCACGNVLLTDSQSPATSVSLGQQCRPECRADRLLGIFTYARGRQVLKHLRTSPSCQKANNTEKTSWHRSRDLARGTEWDRAGCCWRPCICLQNSPSAF